jgi:hypothetical protein
LRKLALRADPIRTAGEIKRKESLVAQKILLITREIADDLLFGLINDFGIACGNGSG